MNLIKKTLITTSVLLSVSAIYAQIKLKDLDELAEGANKAGETVQKIALALNAAGISIAVLFCVYIVATGHPKAKEYVISIIAGLAIYLLAVNFIF